jgi:hypothetical protein
MVKLSPLAHQANAHTDSIWSAAWTGAGGGDLLLTVGPACRIIMLALLQV